MKNHCSPRGGEARRTARVSWTLAGLLALAWLVLRSGAKPSRLAYPCQRAALATAFAGLAGPLAALVALRRRMRISWWTVPGLVLAAAAWVLAGAWSSRVSPPEAFTGFAVPPDPDYRATVFVESDCPQDPVGDRFLCVEDLMEKMGAAGLKFYKSAVPSLTAGPDGILAANDTVVLKINYQWAERGGTNTDLLRGLIRRIVSHPDGFTGEIVVCENAQFASTSGLDRAANNAQDRALSPHDVVVHFQSLGYRVSHVDWTLLRYVSVGEYSAGDLNDGYVVGLYDSRYAGRLSYPKFRTAFGTRISLKYGIWDLEEGYNRERLKLINVPVLKSHHAVYGATSAVKNFMGVVTTGLSTNSHGAVASGILGALMTDIGLPDLNLIDAIWINANPYSGPSTSYADATRTDRLVASRDPVAADLWAVTNILIPGFAGNGWSPPWPYPSADPTLPTGAFRNYLDRSTQFLWEAGLNVTNDPARIDLIALGPPGEASDPTGAGAPFTVSKHPDGFELEWSPPTRGAAAESYRLYRTPLAGLSGGAPPECEGDLGSGTSAIVPALPDGVALLVAARNSAGEGSLGRDGGGRDRRGPGEAGTCP